MKQKCLLARRRKLRLFHFRCAKMSLASLLLLSQKICDFLGSLCFCAAVNDAAAQSAGQRSCENLLRKFSCNHYTAAAKAKLLTRLRRTGFICRAGLAPAEGCEKFDSEGASPFPTFVCQTICSQTCLVDIIPHSHFTLVNCAATSQASGSTLAE